MLFEMLQYPINCTKSKKKSYWYMMKTRLTNCNYLLEKTSGVYNRAFSAEIKEYSPFLFSLYSVLENTLSRYFMPFSLLFC